MNLSSLQHRYTSILALFIKLKILMMNIQTENGKKLLAFCLKYRDGSKSFGNRYVDVGCAEEVNAVVSLALGFSVGGGSSTYLMYQALQDTKRFVKVKTPLGGDIVISPSGYGNGQMKNGHVGFYIGDGKIMSNDSKDGKLKQNYTLASWEERYGTVGGFPVHFYRIL